MSDEVPEYDLVVPFVTVASLGGPHDDEAYTSGWEMGSLDGFLDLSRPQFHDRTIRTANVPQADLVAMHRGYRMHTEESPVDGWTYARFVRSSDA